uniref:BZIP domain-containing protein n=1 Tax=Ascaris lumbricoides TaxID=6252 RepID=A0A0M3IAM5_ASCLU
LCCRRTAVTRGAQETASIFDHPAERQARVNKQHSRKRDRCSLERLNVAKSRRENRVVTRAWQYPLLTGLLSSHLQPPPNNHYFLSNA